MNLSTLALIVNIANGAAGFALAIFKLYGKIRGRLTSADSHQR